MRLPSLPISIFVTGLLFLVGLLVIFRPRLLLQPVVWTFAVWTYLKTIVLLPVNVHEWLVASALEKDASSRASHAAVAAALWGANTEFRPAAREIYGRVCAGYGVFPERQSLLDVDDSRAPGEDPFHAAARGSAASAITNTRGKKPKEVPEAEATKS